MPDITAITTAIQSLKTVTDMAKGIRQSATSLKDANINFQVAELTNALADLKMALADVKEENVDLREHIAQLNKSKDLRELLILRDNAYWPKNEEVNGYGKGPWCSNCFDSHKTLIALHHKLSASIGNVSCYKWECPSCKSSVGAPNKNQL